MTVCTKQSMQVHRESVDNLHSTVDANVKVIINGRPSLKFCTEFCGAMQIQCINQREMMSICLLARTVFKHQGRAQRCQGIR